MDNCFNMDVINTDDYVTPGLDTAEIPDLRIEVRKMNISTKAIVSNSEMIKNFKSCREKAEVFGKLFILKNNQPDSVLFSINEYEKLSVLIEYMESIDEKDFAKALKALPGAAKKKTYTIDYFKNDAQLIISIDEIAGQEIEKRDPGQTEKEVVTT